GLLDDLADGLLVVLGERLVQEAGLLEIAVQATLDDLRDGLLGLALVLGGVPGDAALLGADLLGALGARALWRRERRVVHRAVVGGLGSGVVGGDQHADLRGQVLVGAVLVLADALAGDAADPTDQDLLAHGGAGVGERLAEGGGGEVLGLDRAGLDGGGHGLVAAGDAPVVLGHEVGLGVELDQGAGLAALAVTDVDGDEALGGGAALALGDALEALDADQLDGLDLVAVRLVERLLDVEHARAGGL